MQHTVNDIATAATYGLSDPDHHVTINIIRGNATILVYAPGAVVFPRPGASVSDIEAEVKIKKERSDRAEFERLNNLFGGKAA